MLIKVQILKTRLLSVIAATLLISACTMSNGKTYVAENPPSIDFEFMGVPLLYMGMGSSVPITENLSLTAAHVAKSNYAKVVSYHPECDIALIESDNAGKKLPNLGLIYPGQKVSMYGMDGNDQVLVGTGIYHLDLNFVDNKYFEVCPGSVADAPIRQGMSGGGAYNDKGELVGIIAAMAGSDTRLLNGEPLELERLSIFVSINYVRPWLEGYLGE
ncbi:serine protease [Parasalinivibrio latis]|uniref:S1 family peptidase n=1 Tax=Parasalinivibrio latis TaxID=2952610 RepID=UPI0030E0FF7B